MSIFFSKSHAKKFTTFAKNGHMEYPNLLEWKLINVPANSRVSLGICIVFKNHVVNQNKHNTISTFFSRVMPKFTKKFEMTFATKWTYGVPEFAGTEINRCSDKLKGLSVYQHSFHKI